jgi:hypothetical protein
MQCMGSLLVEVARQAGCPHEAAREFGAAMEQTIRGYVAEIEANGAGTVGAALDAVCRCRATVRDAPKND